MKYAVLNKLLFAFLVFTANAELESKLDEAFVGFEKRSIIRNDSKLFIYTAPPSSVYADGGANISGVKLIAKGNTIASLSPVVKKKGAPALDVIYSKVRKDVSLSKILTDSAFNDLDSNQIYYIIFSWCQAAIIFGKGDANLGLTIDQKTRIKKECGIQEVLDLINYEEMQNHDNAKKLSLLINILKNPM